MDARAPHFFLSRFLVDGADTTQMLNSHRRLRLALALFVVATGATIGVGLLARHSLRWSTWELDVVVALNGMHDPVLDRVALAFNLGLGATGALVVIAVTVATVALVSRSFPATLRVTALIAVPWALADLVKFIVQRPRLDVAALPHPLVIEPTTFSYPSGHTAFAAALCMAAAMSTRGKLRVVSAVAGVLFVLMTAWSRVYLGVHYPLDVLASMTLVPVAAVLVGEVLHWQRLAKWRSPRLEGEIR